MHFEVTPGRVRPARGQRHRRRHGPRRRASTSSSRSSRRRTSARARAWASPRPTASSARPAGTSGSTRSRGTARPSSSTSRGSTPPPSEELPPRRRADWPGSGTILLVEDEPAVRDMTTPAPATCRLRRARVADGAEATAIGRSDAATSRSMCSSPMSSCPGMSGIELAELVWTAIRYRRRAALRLHRRDPRPRARHRPWRQVRAEAGQVWAAPDRGA